MEYRRRNSLRAKGYAYGTGYYAVVILTAERQRFFGEIVGQIMQVSELGSVVLQMWLRIPELHPHGTLDEFQIMPDHFHGILIVDEKCRHHMNRGDTGVEEGKAGVGEGGAGALTNEQSRRARQFKARSLSAIINSFKASVSRVSHRNFPHLPTKIWHRSFFDTVIRDEKHLNNMRQYIRNNVQQWQE